MRRTVLTCLSLTCLSLVLPLLPHAVAPAVAQQTADQSPAPQGAVSPAKNDPGAVSQFMAAQELFAIGRAQKDPLAVLASARLAARIVTNDADRMPDPVAESLPPSQPDATTMFTAAKALAAGDEALADLITRSEAEAARLPASTLLRTTRGIAAGGVQTYTIPFFAAALAEVGLLGDGKANLDLSITATAGNATAGNAAAGETLCLDHSPTDRALCAFALTENASVTVTITNRSETHASYSLLTN